MDNKIVYKISIGINGDLKNISVSLDKFVMAIERVTIANEFLEMAMISCLQDFSNYFKVFQEQSDCLLQFTSNTDIVLEKVSQFQLQMNELKLSISELDRTIGGMEYIEFADSVLSIYTNLKVLGFLTKAASVTQSIYNRIVTLTSRTLYIYKMQMLTARAAIATTTGATKAMNIAIAASPYLIAAAAAVTLGIAIYKLALGNSETAKAQKR